MRNKIINTLLEIHSSLLKIGLLLSLMDSSFGGNLRHKPWLFHRVINRFTLQDRVYLDYDVYSMYVYDTPQRTSQTD